MVLPVVEETFSEELLQPPRGTRDFVGEEKRLRDSVVSLLKSSFEKYGFSPLETPAFENFAVLSAKYAGGEEILKETYRFTDQGERELGLRYDLTVPLCRFVASNKLVMPFKRYAIGSVYRDGPLKLGRYREFTQCDVDSVGASSMLADAEIISLACEFFSSLGVDCEFRLNNRKLLDGLLLQAGVGEQMLIPTILSVDKLEKIGAEGVVKELVEKGLAETTAKRVLQSFSQEASVDALKQLSQSGNELCRQGASELLLLCGFLQEFSCDKRVRLSLSLARGLSYYTGTVFEAFLRDKSKISSSLCGGGRYDNMVGNFVASTTGRQQTIPAVGISFGLDVVCECLKNGFGSVPQNISSARVFVLPVGGEKFALRAISEFRQAGVNSSIDLLGRSISKNLEYAAKQGFSFACIVGKREADQQKVLMRDLLSGEEKLLSMNEAVALAKK